VSTELERRFSDALRDFGPALWRLSRGYEHDPEKRRDLHQEMLVAVWRALPSFEGRSALKTFVLRVAHNTACAHVARNKRTSVEHLVSLEQVDESSPETRLDVERLAELVRSLAPLDRQLILLHLEGLEPSEIADVTGLTKTNVTTKVHRIKALLAKRFGME
jgi:RNA polymerase sigma-70 factor (ECF subfamily)